MNKGENKGTDYQDFTSNFFRRVGQKMYFDLCENFKNRSDFFFFNSQKSYCYFKHMKVLVLEAFWF